MEEYTDEFGNLIVILEEDDGNNFTRGKYPIFECWASITSIGLLVLCLLMITWGYRRDQRDRVNYIALKQNKLK